MLLATLKGQECVIEVAIHNGVEEAVVAKPSVRDKNSKNDGKAYTRGET